MSALSDGLMPFVLHAGYFDGAKFHTFKARDFDAAAAYTRSKGWAVGDFHPSDIGPNVIDVLPPRRAPETERLLCWKAQASNLNIIIHPVDGRPLERRLSDW